MLAILYKTQRFWLAASYLVRPGSGQSIQPSISATTASCIAGRDQALRYGLLSRHKLLLRDPLLFAFLPCHHSGVYNTL